MYIQCNSPNYKRMAYKRQESGSFIVSIFEIRESKVRRKQFNSKRIFVYIRLPKMAYTSAYRHLIYGAVYCHSQLGPGDRIKIVCFI